MESVVVLSYNQLSINGFVENAGGSDDNDSDDKLIFKSPLIRDKCRLPQRMSGAPVYVWGWEAVFSKNHPQKKG